MVSLPYLKNARPQGSYPGLNKKVIPHPALTESMMLGRVSNKIATLTTDAIQTIIRPYDERKYSIRDYYQAYCSDPVINASVELKKLRIVNNLGEYTHSDRQIQEWVRGNFDNMNGAFSNVVAQMAEAFYYGYSIGEIVYKIENNQWKLKEINVLDPKRVKLEGTRNGIVYVLYNNGGSEDRIEYSKCLHILNANSPQNYPWGMAQAQLAMPLYKAKCVCLSDMVVAAKNQATGLLLGYADSNHTVVLLDHNGLPIKNPDGSEIVVSANEALINQLQSVENNSVVVTSKDNQIQWVPMPADSGLFNFVINYLDDKLALAFGLPQLIFREGSSSLGNNGISSNMIGILDSQINALVIMLRDQLIENVVRPLLQFNFGMKKDFGSFAIGDTSDPATKSMRVTNILSAVGSGILPATDLDVQNRIRLDCGLPETDEKKQQEQLMQQMAQQAQQAQMAGGDPNAGMEQQYP